ncbi:MAG TPA: ZIP family metal transporter [Gemmataceae bacterium]|nr:ZIP family metal transporter [Gemmataceae bacterium]
MTESSWLWLYSVLIPIASLLGGHLPFRGRVTHSRLQFYLSLSAGVMLGASFFHVMPEAMEHAGSLFGWWMALGVVGLFCIERFIAPHSHEMDGGGHHHHHHGKESQVHCHDEESEHKYLHPAPEHHDHRAAAPAVAGWMAVVGLTIHTFMNGVGLAGAVQAGSDIAEKGTFFGWVLPGFAMFLAIVLHKPADALAISTVLSRKGVSRSKVGLVQLGFALMVPVGVVAFFLTRGAIREDLQSQLTGAALAFSAGTFLFIALSDLLPEVQFHRHDRLALFLALTSGVALMGGIALLEEEGHTQAERPHGAQMTGPGHAHDADHDQDPGGDHKGEHPGHPHP